MASIASLFAAVLPMTSYLFLIWWMDKNEREPLLFLLLHFIWGALGATLLAVGGNIFLSYLLGVSDVGANGSSLIQTVIFAPISEEAAKGIFLLYTLNSKKFDNITDGLVYGGAIGLGFGMTENFIYFIAYGDTLHSWIQLVLIRSLFSAVMHMISTATLGAFLAMAKFSLSRLRIILPVAGLILAMTIHFIWNSTVSFENYILFGFLFMIILISFFFSVFRLTINNEKKIIEKELEEESILNLIPRAHIKILSTHLRFRRGWIDERIRKLYISCTVKLAFRKNQIKNSSGSSREYYESEIKQLRGLINSMLRNNSSAI